MFKSIRNVRNIYKYRHIRAHLSHRRTCPRWKILQKAVPQLWDNTTVAMKQTHLSWRHRWCKIKINCRVPKPHKERKAGSTAERCGGLATQRPHLLKLRFIAACLVQSEGTEWPASISCLLQRTVGENCTGILEAVCTRIKYEKTKQNSRAHKAWQGLKVLIWWQQSSSYQNPSSHAELTFTTDSSIYALNSSTCITFFFKWRL